MNTHNVSFLLFLGLICYHYHLLLIILFFFFKQKTAYEMRISDWSSDVCSSDLIGWAWLVRVAALAGFILASLVMHPAQGAGSILMSLLGGDALTSLARTGHGAMD